MFVNRPIFFKAVRFSNKYKCIKPKKILIETGCLCLLMYVNDLEKH